jgi:uncharacterized protein
MSPRPKRLRKISNLPAISGFKPYGSKGDKESHGSVFLQYEEYEAIRLCDYEMMNHFQASEIMNVSRPTLTRIYARARQKIAEAMVMGRQIVIEGGKIYFDSEWFSCKTCGCYFNNPDKENTITCCPLCNSQDIIKCENFKYEEVESFEQCQDVCVCPRCGYEKPHGFGIPCKKEACPVCNNHLIKKATQYKKSI